jgi:TonB family protein
MINKYSVLTFMAIMTGVIPAFAEEKTGSTNPPADQPAPAVAPASPSSAPSTTPPEAQSQTASKPAKATEKAKDKTQTQVSQKEIKKYQAKVAGLIAVQARKVGSIGSGSATVSFRINESGSIDNIAVRSSTAPRFADAARRMLSAIHAGPPPGGPISLGQKFIFN